MMVPRMKSVLNHMSSRSDGSETRVESNTERNGIGTDRKGRAKFCTGPNLWIGTGPKQELRTGWGG